MKNLVLFMGLCFLTIPSLKAQDDAFTKDFQAVRTELTSWDPVRGEWLASSLVSISKNEPIPGRTFPEDFTPAEMYRMVPEPNRIKIQGIINNNLRNASDSSGRKEWNTVSSIAGRPNCKPVLGRTYGDPHLSSFDNASYSFQTVGEFVLAKSESQNFEIQARQEPQGDDFSLNTAVAMNVSGDRVCIYANEKPDNISNTALRVNGAPTNISGSTYFLPNGGTIRYSSKTYIVTWPTGEVANIEMRNSPGMNFLNVTMQVYPCAQNDLQGLLGNANGRQNDDFDVKGSVNRPSYMAFSSFGNDDLQRASNQAEKEYLAFLARDFARSYRVTMANTLFEYGFGKNTLSYTDESFPRVHRTVGDLPMDRQDAARRNCEERGISGADLKGCIFDNAYLEIPPSPKPVIIDRTNGVVLGRIDKPAPGGTPKPLGKEEALNGKDDNVDTTPQTIDKPVPAGRHERESTSSEETSKPDKPRSNPIESKPIFSKPRESTPKSSGSSPGPKTPTPVKTSPAVKPGKG